MKLRNKILLVASCVFGLCPFLSYRHSYNSFNLMSENKNNYATKKDIEELNKKINKLEKEVKEGYLSKEEFEKRMKELKDIFLSYSSQMSSSIESLNIKVNNIQKDFENKFGEIKEVKKNQNVLMWILIGTGCLSTSLGGANLILRNKKRSYNK